MEPPPSPTSTPTTVPGGTSGTGGRPTFSVVVPTHRRPDLVADAVASVVAQTRPDWECIVVDDGAGDDLDAVAALDPRIRVVRRPTAGGPAAARNTGLDEAVGRIVTFLDDDDRYLPDRLDLAARGLADPDVGVTVCFTRWFTTPTDPSDPTDPDGHRGRDGRAAGDEAGAPSGRVLEGDVWHTVLDATTPHVGATAVRTGLVPRFDPTLAAAEDVDWWLRLARVARVATVAEVGCELRRHPGERRNGTGAAGRVAASRLLLDRHAEYFRSHPRAEAFRLARTGVIAAGAGDRAGARRLLLSSLERRPSALAAAGLVRVLRPRRGCSKGRVGQV